MGILLDRRNNKSIVSNRVITYLLFIRSLDEIDNRIAEESEMLQIEFKSIFPDNKQHLRWSKFKSVGSEEIYEIVSKEGFLLYKTFMELRILHFQCICRMHYS